MRADRRASGHKRQLPGPQGISSCAVAAAKPPLALLVASEARRRQATERLVEELLSLPEPERHERLGEERFQDPQVFDLLLEAGNEALPCDPLGACEILNLATGLVSLLEDRGHRGGEIEAEGYSRALCLAGTARRLLGDFRQAEGALVRAGCLPVSPLGCGYFCRALAVLRWDQGRSEEATALLHHAQRRYGEGQDVQEESACLGLLGMLCVENFEPWRAAPLLREASQGIDATRRPWLAAQCSLGLAFCHAFAGEVARARSARELARSYYGCLSDEEELLSRWLEGRVAALSGDAEDAAERLESVWRLLLGRRRLPDATLATIDLALLWSETGRRAEIDVLVEELRAGFRDEPGFTFGMSALDNMAEDATAGRLEREQWSGLEKPLRLSFRLQGLSLLPLPFV